MDKSFKLIIGFIVVTCAISFMNTAQATSKEKLVKNGNTFFSSGKYDEAISTYDEAAVDDPESPYIYFNKGAALYKKEDYTSARDAFEHAAIKSKDIVLEAKSKFNSGLCFFREGDRQKDSDLKKTLEAYGSSVQSFQEALTLDPEFFEAAENIEMVRLMMKSVLDQIKKQEEEAKKQQAQAQKTAEKIKELIEKQKDLLNKTPSMMSKEPLTNTPVESANQDESASQNDKNNFQQNQERADAQEQLKNETQHLSEQLTSQAAPPATAPSHASSMTTSPSSPEHPSKQHIDAAVGEQEQAVDRFSKNETQTAADHQQKSLDDLNKALEALKSDPKDQQKGQQQQEKGEKNKDQQNENSESQSSAPEKDKSETNKPEKDKPEKDKPDQNESDQKQPDEKQPENQMVQLQDDANNILDEEKENKKQRMPFSPENFKKVDKDW